MPEIGEPVIPHARDRGFVPPGLPGRQSLQFKGRWH